LGCCQWGIGLNRGASGPYPGRRGVFTEDTACSAVNAVIQQPTDEMGAMLHHIGEALGFSSSEVEIRFTQARRKPIESANPID
jgi:hypothetical protein